MPLMSVTGVEEVLVSPREIVKRARVTRIGPVTRYTQARPGKPDHHGLDEASACHHIIGAIIILVNFLHFTPSGFLNVI